jgi:sugar lactone lactonase YvrE
VAQPPREPLDIRLFARVPPPGQPEPIAIGPDGLVYVGTNQQGRGDAEAPSKVFAFTQGGGLARDYEIRGQKLDEDHGIQGLAFDGSGLLYALDRAADARVVVLDPTTGAQRDYARLRDVPSCSAAGRTDDCSDTGLDFPAAPDYGVFAPDGSLYVTDIEQALIWRVPPGGGSAEVWFTDARLENIFGPNGIQLMADGRTLLFAVTATSPVTGDPISGALYKLPLGEGGRPGELELFWRSRPLDGPDGFAIAGSGNVYLALAGASQLVLISPQGAELARVPATPFENSQLEVPVDGPGSVAFLGERVLVSNHSPIRGDPGSWAVLDVFAGEPGLPLHRPVVAPRPLRPRIRLSVSPRRVRAGVRVRFRFRARLGRRGAALRGARVRFAGRRARTNRRGRTAIVAVLARPGVHPAVARKRGLRTGRARVRVLPRNRPD